MNYWRHIYVGPALIGGALMLSTYVQANDKPIPRNKMGAHADTIDPVPIALGHCTTSNKVSGTVVLTIHDLFDALTNDEYGRGIRYEKNDPSDPDRTPVNPIVNGGGNYSTHLDMGFSKDRTLSNGHSILRIVLDNSGKTNLTLSFVPPPSPLPQGASTSYNAIQAGAQNMQMFCDPKNIKTDGQNQSIELGVQTIDGVPRVGSLNIALMVTDSHGYSTPVILDPKIGNDG